MALNTGCWAMEKFERGAFLALLIKRAGLIFCTSTGIIAGFAVCAAGYTWLAVAGHVGKTHAISGIAVMGALLFILAFACALGEWVDDWSKEQDKWEERGHTDEAHGLADSSQTKRDNAMR